MTDDLKTERDKVVVPPLTDVDLKLLSVFVTVVRCGGFARAQNALNVSQSTISIQISNLEVRIGTKLCQRGRAGFVLTPEGVEVFEAAKRLFAHLENYRAQIGAVRGVMVGEINIGVIDNLADHPSFRVDRAISSFREVAKDVQINVSVAPPNVLEQMVLDGQLHLAISFFPRKLAQLEYEPAFSMQMELYCGEQHPFFQREPSSIELEEIIAMEHAQRGYVSLEQMSNLHRRFNFNGRSHNLEGLAYLIMSGRFLGFLSTIFARRWVDSGLMRPVRSDTLSYTSNYHLAFKKHAPRTLTFDHCLKSFREQISHARQE